MSIISPIMIGTNKAVTADEEILSTDYIPLAGRNSSLVVLTDTSGILSLVIDGVSGQINSSAALDTGKWYTFDVFLVEGSTFNISFSATATMQIKWT